MAAGRGGEERAGARLPGGPEHHLALPDTVADRRHRRRAPDLLGSACFGLAPCRAAGRADDGKLRPARLRTADRQDRRHAGVCDRRSDGSAGARLYERGGTWGRGRTDVCPVVADRGGILDRPCGRRAAQRADDRVGGRARYRGARGG